MCLDTAADTKQPASAVPQPMTGPDCDLRGMPSMLLDVQRLRDSDLAQLTNPEAFRCAVLSWCASWHQVPAASLPDDNARLAYLLGYGRDVRAFAKARAAGGLHGWVKCSDGRLYHPVVAAKALEARTVREKQLQRTEAARRARPPQPQLNLALHRPCDAPPPPVPSTAPSTEMPAQTAQPVDIPQSPASVTGPVTDSKERKGKEREESSLRDAHGIAVVKTPDARTILFTDTVQLVRHMTGQRVDRCKSILGKLLRDLDDDASAVTAIVQDAAELRPAEPLAYIMGAALVRRPRASTAAQIDRDWDLPSFVSPEALAAVEAVGL